MQEFKILNHIILYMDAEGATHKVTNITIDNEFVDKINKENKTNFSLSELEQAANKCIANEWLERTVMGAGEYGRLRITRKGLGVARSKLKTEEEIASQSVLKKISDHIENHNGLFILLSFIVSLFALIVATIALLNNSNTG